MNRAGLDQIIAGRALLVAARDDVVERIGGAAYTVVKDLVRRIRPKPGPRPSLETAPREPGDMAECDWSPYRVTFTHAPPPRGMLFCPVFGRVSNCTHRVAGTSGGTVLMKTKTERIIVADGCATGVVTNHGVFTAPIVISNAGIQPTVLKLVGEQHFPAGYAQTTKKLLPSWALLGYRYFLRRPVTDAPYGVVFSNDSPWSLERLTKAGKGEASREGVVYYEVPSNYDPTAAPPGKQIMITGSFCPPSPQMTRNEITAWAKAGEDIVFEAFPQLEEAIEYKELYTPKDVSNLTRDSVLPGCGGETIGLGQVVGQCGPGKPSIETPVRGLFLVGCDAGGSGVGTQQAIESGMNVADAVMRYRGAPAA
jgi:prolycopene isomerase